MNRRNVLKAGLGAAALFAPLPYAWVWAQSDGTLKLLKAPKMALVVGNGKYKDAPELKNAPNDAKAVAEALKSSGFAVTALMDAGKDSLVQAIRDYVHAMEQKKAVGLFYFAGHGVQLDWRNYMLPVDAVIDVPEDVAKHSVDVARLMEGLTKASNPMNIIILDACREDPFGKARKPQKGLSQMDAPTQTILAYATSPGNVASDGDGANGLYTENLLREMRVPEAKVEDVFKRVRLNVRRTSKGAQIPWESTSLEEDFWFIPPKELKQISDAERERLFKEEQAAWERAVQAAAQAAKQLAEQAASQNAADAAKREAEKAAREAADKAAKEAAERSARAAAEKAAAEKATREAEQAAKQAAAQQSAKLAAELAARQAAEKAAREAAERAAREAEQAASAAREAAEKAAKAAAPVQSAALAPLEEYMRRYPSGGFSELAQFELDRVLALQGERKVVMASSEGNPYTKGTETENVTPQVGYSRSYRVLDLYSKVEQGKFSQAIQKVTDTEIHWDNGVISDLLGNTKRNRNGSTVIGNQSEPLEYSVGKRWTTRYVVAGEAGGEVVWEMTHRITARQEVTVPAGKFNAFLIESNGVGHTPRPTRIEMRRWKAPGQVRGVIAQEEIRKRGDKTIVAERRELVAFKQG